MKHLGLVVVLALVSVGCGISKEDHQKALDEAAAKLRAAEDAGKKRLAVCDKEKAELEGRLAALEGEKGKLTGKLSATQSEIDELKRAREAAERRTRAFRELLGKLRSMIDSKALSVKVRKGRLIVQMSDKVLFEPGKSDLKADGQKALGAIAQVLKTIPDRDFLIAGHTDNKPIRTVRFKSNWELSVARGLEVVKYLQGEGVDPTHLGAAGYSEFDSVGDNSTDEGRAQNRRIEIILMPNISELPEITE
ncbi:MAG: OmpA family protein [Deltaproteobacteria bacterium]|nr:OmpA family protein [Deltaproteobacteria bacterium]